MGVSRTRAVLGLCLWLSMAPATFAQQAAGSPQAATTDRDAAAQAVRSEVERLRQEFEAIKQQYGDRLAALEARLGALDAAAKGQAPPVVAAPAAQAGQAVPPAQVPAAAPAAAPPSTVDVPSGAQGAGGPSGSLPVYGNASALSKIFNPDIAVIGNFLGAAGTNDVNPSPALQMNEAELSLQAVVDPYARADFFLTFAPDGHAAVEEGFLTFTSLPGGLLAKVGQMKASFGKVNQMHPHSMPWADKPLMATNLLGGDEGIDSGGVSVAKLVPIPWFFLEATGEVYGTDSGVFSAPTRGDLSYVARLRGYQDLGDAANIDLGTSFAFGRNDAGADATTRLIGVDATFRYRPLRRATSRRFLARTEMVWSRRSELAGEPQSFGAYVSADYQFARRWFAGARLDYADRATSPWLTDKGGSVLLTFWPSEFSQIRGQDPADPLRRRHDGERVAVPVPVLDRGARGASLLSRESKSRSESRAERRESKAERRRRVMGIRAVGCVVAVAASLVLPAPAGAADRLNVVDQHRGPGVAGARSGR